MPQQPDEELRIARLRADLLDLGLDWNKQYRLVDTGPTWQLEWLQPTTAEQFEQGNKLVDEIMNS